jgi:hypothetical protein
MKITILDTEFNSQLNECLYLMKTGKVGDILYHTEEDNKLLADL